MKFGEALELLKAGVPVARQKWNHKKYVVKQINSDIPAEVIPKMQSLPGIAKQLIMTEGGVTIHYQEQCLIVFPNQEFGTIATNYVPDWLDIFAEDRETY